MTVPEFAGVLASLGVVIAVWWPIRLAIAQHIERRFEATHPRNADGVIIGADPIRAHGTRPGAVLVLHGYNDSPQSVAPLAAALHDAGWTVSAPLLAGHGRTLQAFANSGANDWLNSAREHYRILRADHAQVAVCGMSMGGALAFILAAEHPDITAVVGIAPYLHLSRPMEALLVLAPIAAIGARYMSGGRGKSIHDPLAAATIIAYKRSTPGLLIELTKLTRVADRALPFVRQPVLMIQSREDNRIPVRSASRAFRRIGSAGKTLDWVTGTGHVLTLDYGHQAMERRVIAWLNERMS